jgi:FAD/FMN-containing dehydrogenase
MPVLPPVDPALAELSWLAAACLGDAVPAEDPRAQRHLDCRNTLLRHRPAVVVDARCAHDVVAAVRHAARSGVGLQVTASGRGATHAAAGGVLLSTGRLTEIHVDPTAATAVVAAGVTWRMLAARIAEHRLMAVRGDDPDASVAGDVLNGAGGPWSRAFGAPADAVRALEVALPDGGMARVTAADGELFWALRGGGPGLAVVLAVELALVRARPLTTGVLHTDDTAALVEAWSAALPGLPHSLSTAVELGRGAAALHVFHLGPAEEAAGLLHGVPAAGHLTEADLDPVDVGPRLRAGDRCERGLLLSAPPGPALHRAIEAAARSSGRPDVVVRHLGGQLSRQPEPASAVTGRAAQLGVTTCSDGRKAEAAALLSRRWRPGSRAGAFPGSRCPMPRTAPCRSAGTTATGSAWSGCGRLWTHEPSSGADRRAGQAAARVRSASTSWCRPHAAPSPSAAAHCSSSTPARTSRRTSWA